MTTDSKTYSREGGISSIRPKAWREREMTFEVIYKVRPKIYFMSLKNDKLNVIQVWKLITLEVMVQLGPR